MRLLLLVLTISLTLLSCGNKQPELHIYSWANFFTDKLLADFESRHNCKIVIDTYDSNESLFAKLKLGGAGYDLIIPSNYFMELMRDQGMLEPINQAAITNRSYVDPAFDAILDPALSEYGVPYMLTYTGVSWRNDRVFDVDPSWGMFGRSEFRGRMTMLNDPRETIAVGLLYNGFNVNTLDPKEIKLAEKTIINWKRNLAKFENEQYKNGIASGEYLIVHGYSGDIIQVMQEDSKISFASPKEGITATVDFLSIPKGAQNKNLAHAFINYLYETEPSLQNTIFTGLLVLNKHIYSKLPPMMVELYKPFFDADTLKDVQFIKYLGEDTNLYNIAWDNIKAKNAKGY